MFLRMDEGTKTPAGPSFDVSDEASKQFDSLNCEVGDEVTATMKNTGPGQFEISSVEYDDDSEGSPKEEQGESAADEAEEKTLGYNRPQGKFETPPITGLTD